MPRWLFTDDVVLHRDGTVHRLGCRLAPRADEATMIAAGEEVARRVAPGACWTCRPDMTMLVGPADKHNPPRILD
jgi:hypothetical protein